MPQKRRGHSGVMLHPSPAKEVKQGFVKGIGVILTNRGSAFTKERAGGFWPWPGIQMRKF